MTNHLAKASGFVSVPQGNRVVGDRKEGPVCLDAVPGAHKHFPESEMLLDVLMEGFDPDALKIKLNHLRFGHFEIVGNKKSGTVLGFGDEKQDRADLGQMDKELGYPEAFLFGSADSSVFSRPLGQAAHRCFSSPDFHDPVSFDGGKKCPSCLNNRIENGSAGIPSIHQDCQRDAEFSNGLRKNLDGDLDFALETSLRATAFGSVTPYAPYKTLGAHFDNACDGTQAADKSVGSVMNSDAFDFLALSGTRGVVDNQQRFRCVRRLRDLLLIGFLKPFDLFGRGFQKLMKAVGVVISKDGCNLPDRSEFDKPDHPCQINQEIFSLRLAQGTQATAQIRRNFFREMFSHGFRVLLAFVGIGDFDRKPFYLKRLSSWVT